MTFRSTQVRMITVTGTSSAMIASRASDSSHGVCAISTKDTIDLPFVHRSTSHSTISMDPRMIITSDTKFPTDLALNAERLEKDAPRTLCRHGLSLPCDTKYTPYSPRGLSTRM